MLWSAAGQTEASVDLHCGKWSPAAATAPSGLFSDDFITGVKIYLNAVYM